MDFVDYGDYTTFLHIRDTFSCFQPLFFLGVKKKEDQTAEMVKESAISARIAFLRGAGNNDGG